MLDVIGAQGGLQQAAGSLVDTLKNGGAAPDTGSQLPQLSGIESFLQPRVEASSEGVALHPQQRCVGTLLG